MSSEKVFWPWVLLLTALRLSPSPHLTGVIYSVAPKSGVVSKHNRTHRATMSRVSWLRLCWCPDSRETWLAAAAWRGLWWPKSWVGLNFSVCRWKWTGRCWVVTAVRPYLMWTQPTGACRLVLTTTSQWPVMIFSAWSCVKLLIYSSQLREVLIF